MLQANLVRPKEFVLEQAERPVPKVDEVLIKVHLAGICGSDIHAYYGKHPFIECPIVPGHEFVGTVQEVGDGTTDLLNQSVTVLPSLVCGSCYNCRTGRFNICSSLRVIGCQAPGAFAEYVVVPKDKVFVLPEEFSWEKGVLIEPLAVGVHAVRRIPHIAGRTTLVLGVGTIGLMVVATLKAFGAGRIIAADYNEERLKLAKKLGADEGVNPGKQDLAAYCEQNDVGRIDATFECVGVQSTVNQGIALTRKGGDVVILGVYEEDVQVKMGLVQDKELNMLGTLMYDQEDYHEAIRIIQQTPQIECLITDRFPLVEVSEAYLKIADNASETVKVVLEVE